MSATLNPPWKYFVSAERKSEIPKFGNVTLSNARESDKYRWRSIFSLQNWVGPLSRSCVIYFQLSLNHISVAVEFSRNLVFTNNRRRLTVRTDPWVNIDKRLVIVLISFELQKRIHAKKMSYPAKRKRTEAGCRMTWQLPAGTIVIFVCARCLLQAPFLLFQFEKKA